MDQCRSLTYTASSKAQPLPGTQNPVLERASPRFDRGYRMIA